MVVVLVRHPSRFMPAEHLWNSSVSQTCYTFSQTKHAAHEHDDCCCSAVNCI